MYLALRHTGNEFRNVQGFEEQLFKISILLRLKLYKGPWIHKIVLSNSWAGKDENFRFNPTVAKLTTDHMVLILRFSALINKEPTEMYMELASEAKVRLSAVGCDMLGETLNHFLTINSNQEKITLL